MGPSIACSADFDDYIFSGSVSTASIGTIEVIGNGSEIRGGNITALSLGRLYVGSGAEGMFNTRVNFMLASEPTMGIIGDITVGGQGIFDSIISAGRNLERLTLQSGAKMEYSEIRASLDIGRITADEINYTDIDAFNSLDMVTLKGDRDSIVANDLVIEAGELGMLRATGDIYGSGIIIGGPVRMIQVGGDLISTIEITGPYGDLQNIRVGGDFGTPNGGEIIVDGKIGNFTVTGDFLAGMLVNWDNTPQSPTNPAGPHKKYNIAGNVINNLRIGGTFQGTSDIGGNVGTISTGGDFGEFRDIFTVHGDFRSLSVGSTRQMGDLQSSLYVEGDLGRATIYGDVNGNINVDDNLGTLTLRGKDPDRADLNANVIVGDTFRMLQIFDGDISATNILDGSTLEVKEAQRTVIRGSDIDGRMFAGERDDGKAIEGFDIDGDLNGSYVAADDVRSIHLGGDISEDAYIVIDGDLDELIVDGNIFGVVHVTGSIGRIVASNIVGDINNLGVQGLITAGGDIGSVDVFGAVSQAYILAGFDPRIRPGHRRPRLYHQ